MERDSKRIVREWNREIEVEIRRLAAQRDDGKWKIVVWLLLEAVWLAGLVVLLGMLTRLHW
jgi:cell division septal protein FtsQ